MNMRYSHFVVFICVVFCLFVGCPALEQGAEAVVAPLVDQQKIRHNRRLIDLTKRTVELYRRFIPEEQKADAKASDDAHFKEWYALQESMERPPEGE